MTWQQIDKQKCPICGVATAGSRLISDAIAMLDHLSRYHDSFVRLWEINDDGEGDIYRCACGLVLEESEMIRHLGDVDILHHYMESRLVGFQAIRKAAS